MKCRTNRMQVNDEVVSIRSGKLIVAFRWLPKYFGVIDDGLVCINKFLEKIWRIGGLKINLFRGETLQEILNVAEREQFSKIFNILCLTGHCRQL